MVLTRHRHDFRNAWHEYSECYRNQRQLEREIARFKRGNCLYFGDAAIPFEIGADSFFNILLPHAQGIKHTQDQIQTFYEKIKKTYPRALYWSNNIGAREPGYKNSHLISHGFTYFYENVDIAKDDVVIDVGAAPGDFSAVCASKGASKIVAFEPDEGRRKTLKLVDRLNGSKMVFARYYCGAATHDDTITIDDYVKSEKLPKIDFIKMDIEGAESDALEGAKNVLMNLSPKLSICAYHHIGDAKKIKDAIKNGNANYRIIEKPGIIYAYLP